MGKVGRPPVDPVVRFWRAVDKNGPLHTALGSRCWVWTKGLINGYGQLSGGRFGTPYAHRISWQIHTGEPPDLWVLHKCDNRKCVRPSHLFLGTASDNKKDAVNKVRHAWGQKINTAVLTDELVL